MSTLKEIETRVTKLENKNVDMFMGFLEILSFISYLVCFACPYVFCFAIGIVLFQSDAVLTTIFTIFFGSILNIGSYNFIAEKDEGEVKD